MNNSINLREFQINELRSIFEHQLEDGKLDNQIDKFIELRVLYQSAVKEANTKLDILNEEFKFLHEYNPIDHIKTRVKTPQSIAEKLLRKCLPLNLQSAKANLYDIAGIRVICSFIDDIYKIAEVLESHEDIKTLLKKDYIKNPKTNGYRSLHLIVEIPVFFSNKVEHVPVEIQICTNAMNFWASLEHKMRYKYKEKAPSDLNQELLDCAEQISLLDQKMTKINQNLKNNGNS